MVKKQNNTRRKNTIYVFIAALFILTSFFMMLIKASVDLSLIPIALTALFSIYLLFWTRANTYTQGFNVMIIVLIALSLVFWVVLTLMDAWGVYFLSHLLGTLGGLASSVAIISLLRNRPKKF